MAVDSTTWIAISGVVIAVISLGWNAYNILRDRPKIVLEYKKDMRMVDEHGLHDPNKVYFIITVINKGRRPIKIMQVGVKFLSKGDERWDYGISKESLHADAVLTETNPATNFPLDQTSLSLDNIDFVWATDATGRMYKRKYIKSS